MSFLIPITLFGWIVFTVLLFFKCRPHQAAIISVIGGTLFLPMSGYDPPGLPPFTKETVISIGLLLGGRLSGKRAAANSTLSLFDVPMVLWCLCPFFSSITNDLGVYDGLAGIWYNLSMWGLPYLAGRIYIDTTEKLRDLAIALIIGGLIYMPLCLYEIRMSPQLSNMVYDFFPHSWAQHKRYGGWRPIVFMQHGLMVALWMATTTTALFWMWRSKILTYIKGIPVAFFFLAMTATTLLCKSANGWIILTFGIGSYFLLRFFNSNTPFKLSIVVVSCYMLLRITGGIESTTVEQQLSHLLDADRISSLSIRLQQEELFINKMLERPVVGWGEMNRAWPRIEGEEDQKAIQMIDSLWLIIVSTKGLLGLGAFTAMMFIGPWLSLNRIRRVEIAQEISSARIPLALSLVVISFMIDCLVNGMINPVYILISGALLGWSRGQSQIVDNNVSSQQGM